MHDRKLNRVGAARELRGLQPSDAVLGADAAAQAFDQIEHRQFERVRSADELLGVRAGLLTQIEMQIAVAGVPVGDHVAFGSQLERQRAAFLDERREWRRPEPRRRA